MYKTSQQRMQKRANERFATVHTSMMKTAGIWDNIKASLSDSEKLKNYGIGLGTGLGTGALTYGLTGLTGMSRKARMLAALGVGGVTGGLAGHYGREIRDYASGLFGGNEEKPGIFGRAWDKMKRWGGAVKQEVKELGEAREEQQKSEKALKDMENNPKAREAADRRRRLQDAYEQQQAVEAARTPENEASARRVVNKVRSGIQNVKDTFSAQKAKGEQARQAAEQKQQQDAADAQQRIRAAINAGKLRGTTDISTYLQAQAGSGSTALPVQRKSTPELVQGTGGMVDQQWNSDPYLDVQLDRTPTATQSELARLASNMSLFNGFSMPQNGNQPAAVVGAPQADKYPVNASIKVRR